MFDPQAIIVACWLIFAVYWFISALSVKATQKSAGWLASNWHRALLVLGYGFMLDFRFLRRFGLPVDVLATPIMLRSLTADVIAVIFAVSGLIIAISARRTLAANWSGAVVIKQDQELITRGLYHYVRHPIYTGILLMAAGSALSLGTFGSLIGLLFVFASFVFKMRDEEQLLSRHFPTEYPAYKRQTKGLIPHVW